ncbi:MAG: fructoselysine kinase [Chloroflexi bacterium]|nr:fructoselysine kinase [Chloroflexota bacterium]
MVRVIGVGDNTVDKYMHLKKMFPGGNAVNVAVLAHRYGHPARYIGWLGNDVYGTLIVNALREEGVDTSRCRILDAPNAHTEVTLVDGDRKWGNSTAGVSSQIALNDDDLAFVSQHDLTHTSIYSHIEKDLEKLSTASGTLSFDFSDNWKREYLSQHLPWVHIAILSYADHSVEETEDLLRWVQKQGPRLVLVTQGAQGAMIFDGRSIYRQAIVETRVVDTLGAGDAFAARFLVEHISGTTPEESLSKAAHSASETCGYHGAFGHGLDFE